MALSTSWYRRFKPASEKLEPCSTFPQGLRELYNPSNACADIVFVHGLTGDRERTWTHPDSSQSWPQQILPLLISDARILTYGYDAYVLGHKIPAATNRIGDLARDFLNDLVGYRQQSKSLARPLIFVVHSLGGLVCKDALLLSRNSADNHLNDVVNSAKAIAFIGTPHTGSALARWAKIPVASLGVLKTSSTYLLSILHTNSDVLCRIQSDFLELIRARAKEDRAIEITCFHEALSMPMVGKIVLRESAVLAGFNSISIYANHRNMVKFKSPSDSGLRSVFGELSRWMDVFRTNSSASNPEMTLADMGIVSKEPAKMISPTQTQYENLHPSRHLSQIVESDILDAETRLISTKSIPRFPESSDMNSFFEEPSAIVLSDKKKEVAAPQDAIHRAFLRRVSENQQSTSSKESPSANDSAEDARGPLGLTILHCPNEVGLDIVFVHGLGGGSRRTWSYSDPKVDCWPQEFLAKDKEFENCRLHSFGYNSDFSKKGSAHNVSGIADFASALLGSLLYSPGLSEKPETPIVFVCHSMGGLIVKKALLQAQNDPVYRSIATRIRAMIFLATPHRGAGFASILNKIMAASVGLPPKRFIKELDENSATIQTINEEFRHVASRVRLFSFYETRTTGIGTSSSVIVDKSSAVLGYPNEVSMPLDANHHQMCRFSSPDDPNYRSLKGVLATIVTDIALTNGSRVDLRNIYNFLLLDDSFPQSLQANRINNTSACLRWLVSNPAFREWSGANIDPGSHCLRLHAAPGAGKSFLAEQLVGHLRSNSCDVGYFFFSRDHLFHSSILCCLKSITYQLAESNKEIGRRLRNLIFEDDTFGPENFRDVWDKIFVQRIFKMSLSKPLYIVIDAIDECSEVRILLSLLRSPVAVPYLRLLLTSRTAPPPNTKFALRSIQSQMVSLEISPLAIASDAEVFVSQKSAELKWMSGDMLERTTCEILQRSSGCFRWIEYIFNGLQKIYTARGIRELLECVPPDMAESYKTALDYATETCPEPRLLNSALAWAVYNNGPLTVIQLQEMVEADLEERVFRLKEFLQSFCGDFLHLDPEDRVNFVHDTARTFLIDSAGLICLKGDTHI